MDTRTAMTIRFPERLLGAMRDTKRDDESLNDMVIAAMEREIARRKGFAAFEEILKNRRDICAHSGALPDSTSLIRAMREGDQRRD